MSDSITPKISENDPFMRLFEKKLLNHLETIFII